jgi:hypothetical protein
MENINELIKTAIKEKDDVKKDTYRAVKTAILNFKAEHKQAEPTDAEFVSIVKKLKNDRLNSAKIYTENNRSDLAYIELKQAEALNVLLPQEVSQEQAEEAVFDYCINHNMGTENGNIEIPKKNMGMVIKAVKEKLVGVDGKMLSEIVKGYLI